MDIFDQISSNLLGKKTLQFSLTMENAALPAFKLSGLKRLHAAMNGLALRL